MTLRKYLTLVISLTLICWLIFLLVIFLIDPEQLGILGFFLFYFSLFLALGGTLSIIGFLIRARLFQDLIFYQVKIAFRQGFILSGLIVFLLVLKGLNLLYWWNAIILILFLISLEIFLILRKKR